MEARPKHRVLSREEEAEISRSKKKVKDVHHAGFNDGTSEGGQSQWHQGTWGSPKKSFKDKLVGEIPGAFAKAFDFTDLIEDEAESDDEMLDLREGLAAVKLSRETKLRIRSPWALTLIIKLFGKAVGFNFLHSKLNLLWKPSGRFDLVNLGHGFYSVRFSLKEDLNAVLEKGPWFINGHFLSIRPWEPLFKPAAASVTSIAVWVRLHELPMELYETEVLKQIGDSIGKVLRIDSHTAMEARGKYARLCIQIDINKPLINTVLIGRFEQQVTYEGIHKLCFSCGRVDHRKEVCPYTIRNPKSPEKGVNDEHENQSVNPHAMHATDKTNTGSDTTEGSGADTDNNLYGPWMIVTRRKTGQRRLRNAAVMEGPTDPGKQKVRHEVGQGLDFNYSKVGWAEDANILLSSNPKPDGKMDQVGPSVVSFTANQLEASGTNKLESNTYSSPSVRGKKVLARYRASSSNLKIGADYNNSFVPEVSQPGSWKSADGIKRNSNAPFKFAASFQSEVGHPSPGKDSGGTGGDDRSCVEDELAGLSSSGVAQADTEVQLLLNSKAVDYGSSRALANSLSREKEGVAEACVGVDRSIFEERLEANCSVDGRGCKVGFLNTARPKVEKDEEPEVGVCDESKERKDGRGNGEDRMEFEEGEGTGISS